MPKGLAPVERTNDTTSWRANKKMARLRWLFKKKTGTYPRPATFTVCEDMFSFWRFGDAWRIGVCWSFLGATLRLYWLCVEMTALICNLKKAACKQVLQANTEIAFIYDDILCTRISTFVDAFPCYFNCSGWRMKKSCSIYKRRQGHPEIYANPCFFILKDCQYHVNTPIQYNTTWYNTTSKDLFCSQLINKTVRSSTYQWFGLILFFIRRTITKNKLFILVALSRKNPLLFLKTHG